MPVTSYWSLTEPGPSGTCKLAFIVIVQKTGKILNHFYFKELIWHCVMNCAERGNDCEKKTPRTIKNCSLYTRTVCGMYSTHVLGESLPVRLITDPRTQRKDGWEYDCECGPAIISNKQTRFCHLRCRWHGCMVGACRLLARWGDRFPNVFFCCV